MLRWSVLDLKCLLCIRFKIEADKHIGRLVFDQISLLLPQRQFNRIIAKYKTVLGVVCVSLESFAGSDVRSTDGFWKSEEAHRHNNLPCKEVQTTLF